MTQPLDVQRLQVIGVMSADAVDAVAVSTGLPSTPASLAAVSALDHTIHQRPMELAASDDALRHERRRKWPQFHDAIASSV